MFLQFEKLNPDLVVVVAYGLLLPEKFAIPQIWCINGHASLYQGGAAAPIQRAIEAEDILLVHVMLMERVWILGQYYLQNQ